LGTIGKNGKINHSKITGYKFPFNVIFLLILCSVFIFNHSDASAANAEKKLLEIQEKLSSKLDALKETSRKEKSVTEKLKDINSNINKKEKELKHYSKRISQTHAEMQDLSDQIDLLSGRLERNIQYLEEVIIAFYKQQYESNALILLSANDYQDLIQKMKYSSLVAHYDSSVINKYGEEIRRIQDKREKLDGLRKGLHNSVDNARNKRNELYKNSKEKDRVLARLKARRAMYEKNIKELEESSQKVQSMLTGIKSESLPKSIVGKGFKTLKGKLPWPVEGEIMKPYGKNAKLESNTSAFKSGIEIKAKPEDLPETVAGGRVVYAGKFKGYGKLVIIDHGSGYHSLYGNLSGVSLKKGDIVIKGFKVGKIGMSETMNAPTLYFEIRRRGRPIDPTFWLKREPRKLS
jgi:septal ring factor EnvC (AmiA/AmiB activator)